MENQSELFIDGWHIDVASHRIARDGTEIKLEPRSMELLVYLAGRPDRVVSREEIEANVWRGRVVGYEALSGAIGKLRKAFGDTSKDHHVIETVPKSGYRLIAPVVPGDVEQNSIVHYLAKVPKPPVWAFVAAAALAIVALTMSLLPEAPNYGTDTDTKAHFNLADKPSIAVLPFTNMSDDPTQEYFADGITEDLTTDLSRMSGMFVIARNSAFHYKNKSVNIQQIAEELGVRYVLEGSVRRADGLLRINAQLIDATTGGHLWAQRYDGELEDVFTLQDEITRKIVKALAVSLTPAEEIQQAKKQTSNLQAYEAYVQGSQLRPFDSAQDFAKTVSFYETAVELDPTYSNAHVALAKLYWRVAADGWENVVGIRFSQARDRMFLHARKAMEYPTASAHQMRAIIMSWQSRWDEAFEEAVLAISLNPNDSTNMTTMSSLLIKLGRPTEAQIYFNEALRLDPGKTDCYWLPASIRFHLEQYGQAVAQLQVYIEHNPEDEWLHLLLAASYGHLGKEAEGQAEVQKFNKLRADKGHSRPYAASELNHWSIKDNATRARIRDGLVKAGMPKYY
jgi:adenylate cyclase